MQDTQEPNAIMELVRIKTQCQRSLKVSKWVTHPRLQAFSGKNTEVAQHFQPFELLRSPLLDFGSIFVAVLLRRRRCARCCCNLFLSALMCNQAHHACHIVAHTVQLGEVPQRTAATMERRCGSQ